MLDFIKNIIHDVAQPITVNDIKAMMCAQHEKEYRSFQKRKNKLLRKTYNAIRTAVLWDRKHIFITSFDRVAEWPYVVWSFEDIMLFAQEYEETFRRDGYEFVYKEFSGFPCKRNSITINWKA